MASFSFNAAEVAPQQPFELIPAGTYTAVAVQSETKETRTGGEMIVYRMQITDGDYANRTLFARFNVKNASAKAREIGLAQLSAFCRAAGVMDMTDTDDLLDKPVAIRVKIREAQGEYGPSNEIAGFAALVGAAAPAPRPAAPAASSSAPPKSAPWSKKAA